MCFFYLDIFSPSQQSFNRRQPYVNEIAVAGTSEAQVVYNAVLYDVVYKQYIMHFYSELEKNLKRPPPQKKLLMFRGMEHSCSNIKKILIFMEMELFNSNIKKFQETETLKQKL